MSILETDRLVLRGFMESDLEDMYEYAKSPNVGPNAGWKPHANREETLSIIKMFTDKNSKDIEWGIVYKESGKLIGSIGLHEEVRRIKVPDCKEIGYVLSDDYWGRGIMSEAISAVIDYAFSELKLKLLAINHYTQNKRSMNVIKKAGFVYEGTIRSGAVSYDGSLKDCVCYSMTRREYLCRKGNRFFSLILPEHILKEDYCDYITQWKKKGEKIIPSAIDRKEKSYEQWLENNIRYRTKAPDQFVEATTYFLVDKSAGKIHGAVDIRHRLNDFLTKAGGHIGYGVSPLSRRTGKAEIMLAMALEKARDLGIESALITCNEDNLGSAKTIEACGGVLENVIEVKEETETTLMRRYWIHI